MLAGQCVIYDAMLRDGARDLLRGQPEEIKLRGRPVNLASGRMFLTTVHTLLRMRDRAADKVATQPAEEPRPAAAPSPRQHPVTTPRAACLGSPAGTRRSALSLSVPAISGPYPVAP
jgi:hypothetical protein